jgi:hypothetical protein
MSEYGSVQANYEIDRLAGLAAELGYARRSSDAEPQRTAPGTVASDVQRYTELADEMGLSARSTGRGMPSLGR